MRILRDIATRMAGLMWMPDLRVKNILHRAVGLKRDTLRRIDVAEELRPGRLIFADVGRHQTAGEVTHLCNPVEAVS